MRSAQPARIRQKPWRVKRVNWSTCRATGTTPEAGGFQTPYGTLASELPRNEKRCAPTKRSSFGPLQQSNTQSLSVSLLRSIASQGLRAALPFSAWQLRTPFSTQWLRGPRSRNVAKRHDMDPTAEPPFPRFTPRGSVDNTPVAVPWYSWQHPGLVPLRCGLPTTASPRALDADSHSEQSRQLLCSRHVLARSRHVLSVRDTQFARTHTCSRLPKLLQAQGCTACAFSRPPRTPQRPG